MATGQKMVSSSNSAGERRWLLLLAVAVVVCSVYANLSFLVENPADYRFFPPFRAGVNANHNRELGNECFEIARALRAGKGFANPFQASTGPTSWMPPTLPAILAGLLWACDDNRDAVTAVAIFLQAVVLAATGMLVLAVFRRTSVRAGSALATLVFVAALAGHFHRCFQHPSDCWIVLLLVNVLGVGLCWWRPLASYGRAAAWGLFGGVCALTAPVAAFAWTVLTCLSGCRQRTWGRLLAAAAVAVLAVTPWTIRNYLVFGRLIPVKANLAYEAYQSQCLQPDGLLRWATFHSAVHEVQVREYRTLGEAAFLERKGEQFRQAVRADAAEFCRRVGQRFCGATLWYEPYYPYESACGTWARRLIHPLPFLALVVLLLTAARQGLYPVQWIVIGIYVVYLLPYVVISYYERYAIPLLGVKSLLVLWAVDRLWAWHTTRAYGGNIKGSGET